MYAIVGVAGFQFKVATDQVVRVPLMAKLEAGQKITLDNVLMISDGSTSEIGKPSLAGASVEAEIVKHGRTREQLAGVYKKRKDYRRHIGFRADYSEIRVTGITPGSGAAQPVAGKK